MPIINEKATRSPTWWVGIAAMAASAVTFAMAQSYGKAGLMPGTASAAIFLLALSHTVYGLLWDVTANNDEWYTTDESDAHRLALTQYVLVALAVGVSVWLVGFHITLPIFLFAFIAVTTRAWIVATAMAVIMFVFTYVILDGVLNILLPASVLRKFLIANGWF